MELNKENMKKIRWLIAFSVLLYLGVQNLDVVLKYVKIVWGLLLPFVLGGAMAFVLNVPMAFIERHVFGKAKEKEDRRGRAAAKFARPVSLLFSIVLVVLAILVVVLIVAPELGRTLVNVVKKVEEDKNAVGYVAYSSATDTNGKILQINGVLPSEKTIDNNSYPLCRDYYLAYNGELTDVEQDFLTYVKSKGQDIVKQYCIQADSTTTFLSDKSEGKILIEGSTSMEPMVKALADDYQKQNPNAEIEVKATDSSRGITAVISGECDFAMSSRELKDYEAELLETKVIGKDAIAIVINEENPLENLTIKQLTGLYNGTYKNWDDLS